MGLPYERAEKHNCPDGEVCLGHTVDVTYEKIMYGGQEISHRVTRCGRCGNSCDTEQSVSAHNYRIGG